MTQRWSEETLFACAKRLGFAEAALCSAAAFEAARDAVCAQPPIRERRQLRFVPMQDDARTRSLAVLLWPYSPARIEGAGRVFVDSYYDASNAAYHAARALEETVKACGGFARANAPYPAREAAVRAGLGLIGRNGLLITPRFGSRVVIILLATDLPAPQRGAEGEKECLSCGRCALACPAGAIDEAGMRHPERCLRNFMMEGVVVPEALRERMGMRLLGCDVCQRVCPMQPPLACDKREAPPLGEFLTADEVAFSAAVARLADRIGRNAARPQRVRAQAALLSGNRRDPACLPVLRKWAQSPFEAVREHARWAIERIEEAERPSRARLDRISQSV